jgi:hypothetical protein
MTRKPDTRPNQRGAERDRLPSPRGLAPRPARAVFFGCTPGASLLFGPDARGPKEPQHHRHVTLAATTTPVDDPVDKPVEKRPQPVHERVHNLWTKTGRVRLAPREQGRRNTQAVEKNCWPCVLRAVVATTFRNIEIAGRHCNARHVGANPTVQPIAPIGRFCETAARGLAGWPLRLGRGRPTLDR